MLPVILPVVMSYPGRVVSFSNKVYSVLSCKQTFHECNVNDNRINKIYCGWKAGERDREADRERVHESIFRIRDRRRLDSVLRDDTLRSLERETKGEIPTSENAKKGHQQTPSPLVFGDELQYWLERVKLCSTSPNIF